MNLSDWRRRIDEIDKKLVQLLNERSQCALEIGKLKQEAKIPLYQPDRENEVLENARSEEHTSELQSRLHLVCRLLLEKKKKKKKKAVKRKSNQNRQDRTKTAFVNDEALQKPHHRKRQVRSIHVEMCNTYTYP